MNTLLGCAAMSALLFCGMPLIGAQLPVFSPGGPDANAYGSGEHFPVGSATTAFEKKYIVGSFSHFYEIFPGLTVLPAAQPWGLQRASPAPEITYIHAGSHYALKDYLQHMPVTGLLIAKDDQILYEGYQYARSDHDLFTSQSMAKTVVGMLAGIAVSEHAIGSIADVAAKCVPELKDSDYGKVSLRDLLHMSSGVNCEVPQAEEGAISLRTLAGACKQAVPAGTRFRYSAADSEVLGLAVSRAVQKPLASYLQEKIWQKIGTESRAVWTTDPSGREMPFCCFNATLRDYARLGRLLAHDGAWNGNQLIPEQWVLDATTVKESDSYLQPGKSIAFFGYGYQLWIFPGSRRMFALIGANGQRIFVDPQTKLILVQTAVMEKAMDPTKDAETIGLWLSLVHHYRTE